MKYVQLLLQREAAHDTLDELGRRALIHFRDLNPHLNPMQREFVQDVRLCDDIQRCLRFFTEQIEKSVLLPSSEMPQQIDLHELKASLEDQEKELKQMNSHEEMLHNNLNELIEMRYVLRLAAGFFDEAMRGETGALFDIRQEDHTLNSGEYQSGFGASLRLGFITGVILRDRLESFHRTLYMAIRGNCYLQTAEIDKPILDPSSGELVNKNVFIVFFSGAHAQQKIGKICESYGANKYPMPENPSERQATLEQVQQRLGTLETVINRTVDHREHLLRRIASHIEAWAEHVQREKAIYHTLNMFSVDTSDKCLIGEGWVPKQDVDAMNEALQRASERSHATVPAISRILKKPTMAPTYFRTNKFTVSPQALVTSFGVAKYREVNPGLMTVMTFPYLFGVMFGDFGHGPLLLIMALLLCLFEKRIGRKKLGELFSMLFNARWLLLTMGIFATYMGLLYNDTFSVPIDFFKSAWIYNVTSHEWQLENPSRIYPFGIDPIWGNSENNLVLANSMKMKHSIIVGVSQMIMGIFFHLFNAIHFGHKLDIFFEFIPQILFMSCFFGYMAFIMFIKWWTDYKNPPSIIQVMIKMFLNMGHITGEALYPGQAAVQVILVILCLISVPLMLIPKPVIIIVKHKMAMRFMAAARGYRAISSGSGSGSGLSQGKPQSHGAGHGGVDDEEEFSAGEVFIGQLIETIEFVLGCISHTASYLRLWALSLAHAELSHVFWNYMVIMAARMVVVGPLAGVALWIFATLFILMGMECLSAFLHGLRLHWVEFQSKFYKAGGYNFAPLDFSKLGQEEEED